MSTNIDNFNLADKHAIARTFRHWKLPKLADLIDHHNVLSQLDRLADKLSIPTLEEETEKLLLVHADLDKGLIDILSDQQTRNHLAELLREPRVYYDTVKELQSSLPLEYYSPNLAYSAENIRSFLISAHEAILKRERLGSL